MKQTKRKNSIRKPQFDEKKLARRRLAGFRFLLAGYFANGFVEQLALLLPSLALNAEHIQKREHNRKSRTQETHHPIKQERNFAQIGVKQSFPQKKHHHGNNKKSHASFAMPDAWIAVHVVKIASKLFPTENFLAGIPSSPEIRGPFGVF
jgi:hypothetical protein